jgi:hypothetical protein
LADVFISCSCLDETRVQPIAERLGSLGYSVWWAKRERTGQALFDEAERQCEEAKAVLAVWSHHARNSSFVLGQGLHALEQARLLQMQIDDMRLPAPFDVHPVADMSGGKSEWGKLEDALARLVREGRAPEALERNAAVGGTPPLAGMPRLVLAGATAALAAYASAMASAFNGVMTPDQLRMAAYGVLGVGAICTALAVQRLFAIRRAGG